MLKKSPFHRLNFAAIALVGIAACTAPQTNSSDILVTEVDHTEVKRQSIGNCWIYAHATWLESKLLTTTGQETNVSESYWTYWHWYRQLTSNKGLSEISTGGHWTESTKIILEYGWVLESEFIVAEADEEMSTVQYTALNHMNEQLKPGGALESATLRTKENIRAELDKAFGIKMEDILPLARKAADTVIKKNSDESTVSLKDALSGTSTYRWQEVRFPRVHGKDSVPTAAQENARKELLLRVMRALNDRQPVVMSLMIDFNALDNDDDTFKTSLLEANGAGSQGGHMVVLHDYVVDNVPGIGRIDEGNVSDDMKAEALKGDLVLLKAKNSWGKNRPESGLKDGYSRFKYDYLTKQLEWKNDSGTSNYYTTLTDFVLPPGY